MSVAVDPTPTTTQLLRSAGAGDPGAWKEIVRRYEPAVVAGVGLLEPVGDDHRGEPGCACSSRTSRSASRRRSAAG